MKKIMAVMAVAMVVAAVPAMGANAIPNVRVTDVSSQFGGSGERASVNVVNTSGLNGLDQHSTNSYENWLSNGESTPDITFQLPQNMTLSNMHVWNYPENARGVQDVEIFTSTSDVAAFTSQGTYTFPQAPNNDPTYTGFDATSIGWTPVANVRRVMFDVISNYGDGYTGLEEVRFETTDALAAAPAAGAKILGVTAVASSSYPTRPGSRTVDGSGMSGVFPNEVHDDVGDNMWRISDASVGQQGTIVFDLQSAQPLGGVKIWGYGEGQAENSLTYFNLEVSTDGINYSDLGDFSMPGRATDYNNTHPHPGLDIDLRTATDLNLLSDVQYVRLTVLSTERDMPDGDNVIENNTGSPVHCGIAEVQFFAGEAAADPIPEPAGLGLVGLALLAVRKRRS